ncbi:uncharacterized protein CANTADRAFT_3916 [Suhomyces tanzawaensis NRRL Y-17324]|uniref:SAP domain-containing protein n=1 Tax=Suhomyces tanzawaensis NRRL Y-17324 TaxID=984487 RepID=A0A1E4SQR8_9ASCO|nr:uncharacterized protein CANTADRAFT_3916 [Suhomyces tanzawaensis NRRL Y-17324]ODV81856.1 hypothetical protein CANTADRAFT_3916 [Suhomyces tanzawaensis NRRL Y-17324]
MSEFSNLKKADLVHVLKQLEIHTLSKDTKKVLLEKLNAYIAENPSDSTSKIQSIVDEKDELAEEATLAEDEEDDEAEDAETEDAEDDDDEEEAAVAAAEDDEDPDYNAPPPINLKQWVVDPIIDASEQWIARFYEYTDSVGITYLEYSDVLRERLSTTVTLNFVELLLEASFFLYTHVPVVALKNNALNHQLLKDNNSFFAESTLPTPELTALLQLSSLYTLALWGATAVALPLLVSYYVNFSRRVLVFDGAEGIVGRIYSYDPFIFAVAKVVIFYFVGQLGPLTNLHSLEGIWYALQNRFLIQVAVYSGFVKQLGAFPLVLGVANVAVALYSQFEDY